MLRNAPGNGHSPPYEPFMPEQRDSAVLVSGPKQAALYQILQLKHALKLELKGLRISRGGSAYGYIKKRFGLTGSKQKVFDAFAKMADDMLQGKIPVPGYPEEPNAWKAALPPSLPDAGPPPEGPGTSFMSNPSEPTGEYEDMPAEEDRLDGLFAATLDLFKRWRVATEQNNDRDVKNLNVLIKQNIHFIESNGYEPPAKYARTYEFIKKFFGSGAYLSNPPQKERLFLREMQEYDLKNGESEVRALEMILDSGAKDPDVVAQFFTDCRVYGLGEAFVYLQGYAKDGYWTGDLNQVKAQVNKLLARHNRTRRFNNNPWLIAGPNVAITQDGNAPSQMAHPDAQPTITRIHGPGAPQVPALPAPQGEGGPDPEPRRPMSEEERRRRSRMARRMRRGRQGQFRGFRRNPWEPEAYAMNPAEIEHYRPNPSEDDFTTVSSRGGKSVGFKYDSTWQRVTIRVSEESANRRTVFEIDIPAYPNEAQSMLHYLRTHGFVRFTKAMKKAGRRVTGRRQYQETIHTSFKSPMGGALEGPTPSWSWGGKPSIPQSRYSSDEHLAQDAIRLADQVAHEVQERDLQGALMNLKALLDLVNEAASFGHRSAWSIVQRQYARAKGLVDAMWPNG